MNTHFFSAISFSKNLGTDMKVNRKASILKCSGNVRVDVPWVPEPQKREESKMRKPQKIFLSSFIFLSEALVPRGTYTQLATRSHKMTKSQTALAPNFLQ